MVAIISLIRAPSNAMLSTDHTIITARTNTLSTMSRNIALTRNIPIDTQTPMCDTWTDNMMCDAIEKKRVRVRVRVRVRKEIEQTFPFASPSAYVVA